MTLLIERESDRDGVRFYWQLKNAQGETAAAGLRHRETAEEAEADARTEASAVGWTIATVTQTDITPAR